MTKNNLIYIAKIGKAHGIKGEAKIISYSDNPEDIFSYPCLYDENLNEYKIKRKGNNIASINNINSRNIIEELVGIKLYITKDMLPKPENDEYYWNDLIGLKILDEEHKLQGHIKEIHNFGAGDIIEMQILDSPQTSFLPFEKEFIIAIDINTQLIFNFSLVR